MTTSVGYSGTPLPRKLGIRAGSDVLLVDPPVGFELAPLPDAATVRRTDLAAVPAYDVVLAFCPDHEALERCFVPLTRRLTSAGALWVGWPKKASGVATDLDENVVRAHGLAAGLVDTKVCAVDETWSGLRFVVRLRDR